MMKFSLSRFQLVVRGGACYGSVSLAPAIEYKGKAFGGLTRECDDVRADGQSRQLRQPLAHEAPKDGATLLSKLAFSAGSAAGVQDR